MLIRVTKAQQVSAAQTRPPEYREGVYSTIYYQITEEEDLAMKIRRRQFTPSIGETMSIYLQHYGVDLNNRAERDAFLSKLVQTESNSEMVDLNYHSQYIPQLGFRFNIEAIHNSPVKGFYAVLMSVLPQATYYDQRRTTYPKDAFSCHRPDWDAPV